MKNKTKTATYWRKKGSTKVKEDAKKKHDYCEMCGVLLNRKHPHHLLSEGAYPEMSNVPLNIIVICPNCHMFGRISFHGNGLVMKQYFEHKFPGRLKKLQEMSNKRRGKVDYEKEYKKLC